jgi:hypothetical protein
MSDGSLPDWAVSTIVERAGRSPWRGDEGDRIVDKADFAFEMIRQRGVEALSAYDLPHVVMRPSLAPDGDMWCALYGDNIATGVCGFGKTPADAMADFDHEWYLPRGHKHALEGGSDAQ